MASEQEDLGNSTSICVEPTFAGNLPFDILNFKCGVYYGIQFVTLIFALPTDLKKRMLVFIPFLIQICWTITGVTWTISFYVLDEESNRNLQITSRVKWLWITVIASGIVIALVCNIVLTLSLFLEMTESMALITTVWYQFADFYISILEVFSLISFMSHRFNAKSYILLLEVVNRLKLTRSIVIMLLSAVASFILLVTAEIGYDADLNLNGSIAAIKYAVTCQLVLDVFSSTIKTKVDKSEIADAVESRRSNANAKTGSQRIVQIFNRPRGQSDSQAAQKQTQKQQNRMVGSLQLSDDDLEGIPEELNIKFKG